MAGCPRTVGGWNGTCLVVAKHNFAFFVIGFQSLGTNQ